MISVCPSCSRQVNISEDLIGREVKCPNCMTIFRVGHGDRHEILDASRPMPVQPYGGDGYESRAANPLVGPGIGLLVAGILSLLYAVFNAIAVAMMMGKEIDVLGQKRIVGNLDLAVGATAFFFSFLVLVGSVCLLMRRGYGFAWVGAICGVMPLYYCCFIGLPFGIWAMVLLTRDDVKRSFQ